ncbi:F-box protein [Legionella sp. WA2022007384]
MGIPSLNLKLLQHMDMMKLPQEVLFQILDQLSLIEIQKLKNVSKAFNTLASNYLNDELKIKEISCGQDFTLILLSRGRVLAIGSNSRGQLGLGLDIKQVSVLTETPLPERINHISSGFSHSMLLSMSGKVFAMGRNDEQQIKPESNTSSYYVPTLIEVPSVKTIFTVNHTSALFYTDSSGKPFELMGNKLNSYQFGRITLFLPEWTPIPPTNLDVANISVSDNHALLLTTIGEVYVCGNNESGLLGLNPENLFIDTWTKLPDIRAEQIKATALGCLIMTHDKSLIASGLNTKGQLGPSQNHKGFTCIASDVRCFDATDHHTVYVDNKNELFHFGAMTINGRELRTVENGLLPIQGYQFLVKPPASPTPGVKALVSDFFKSKTNHTKQVHDETKNIFSL